jgi:uncharacterized protein
MKERALVFDCQGENLVGVLAEPDAPAHSAVLVVVGGPQYRAGSHRQFVQLARTLAEGGVAVLRFDCRGMGDSSGTTAGFEDFSDDIAAALQALQAACPMAQHLTLWGLCDGASAALLYLHDTADARVSGLVLLNPWVRSAASLARTHVKHYYVQRLLQGEFWRKLLSGGVARRAATDLLRNLRIAVAPSASPSASVSVPFQDRMRDAWLRFEGPVLLVLSGNDYTAKEFLEHSAADATWHEHLARAPRLTRLVLADADHTFSSSASSQALENATLKWLQRLI